MARAGAARVFFDIVGTFQANKLIKDTKTAATVQQAILADAAANIADGFDEMASAVLESVTEITDAFYAYETQLIRVRKFYGGITGEADRFAESAKNLGLQFGFTGEQALAASTRTSQLKNVLKSQEAIIEATRAGLLMAAVGEMETEMGMNRLIALAQQTGFMMGNLTKAQYDQLGAEQQANLVRGNTLRVLDQLNTVENTSVATMEDITFVLNQFASQANIAGESIGEMAAMSALLLETGEEVSRAGTGLRMIYQRIGNENTQAVKELQKLMGGVEASTVTQMKLSDIIKEIGPAYASMSAEQKRNLAVSIAGSRHYVKFLKLMENQPRLLELQQEAYLGTHDAIGEFSNRAESAVFEMEQLQAAITNLQVELGENLTDAYFKATSYQHDFYEMVVKISEHDFGLKVMENVIQLSGLYTNLARPFADVGFQVFNMIIAFKTLGAVQKMMSMEAHNQKNAYMAQANTIAFVNSTQNAYSANHKVLSQQMATSNSGFSASIQNMRTQLGGLRIARKENIATSYQQHSALQALTASYNQGITPLLIYRTVNDDLGRGHAYTEGSITSLGLAITANDAKFHGINNTINTVGANLGIYTRINATSATGLKTFNAFQSEGVAGLRQRNDAMVQQIAQRKEEHALMQSEFAMIVPLTAAEKTLHTQKLMLNNSLINENRIKIGLIRSDMIRMKLSGEAIPQALLTEVAALETSNASMMEHNLLVEQSIIATEQAELSLKEKAMAEKRDAMSTMQGVKADMQAVWSNKSLAGAIKGVNGAMMPIAMLLPFIVDSEKQMSAIITAMVVPALFRKIAALKLENAEKGKNVVLTGMMTSGLSLLGAAAAMAAGFLLVDAFMSKTGFMSGPLDNLNEFNEGLNTMESRLADIMSSDEAILPGIVDSSMQDIKHDEKLLGASLATIRAKAEEYRQGMSALDEDSILYGDMNKALKAADNAEKDILGVLDSKRRLANINRTLDDDLFHGAEMNTYDQTQFIGLDFKHMLPGGGKVGMEYDKEMFNVTHADLTGRIYHEQFDDEQDALDRMAELNEIYDREALIAQKNYLDLMFAQQEDANKAAEDQLIAANETAMGEMFGFANAREELFFGQRQNFTGALYKQVSQGGIENLLHKTEIIQTNVFNGMTLPEMVSQVADGVRAELRTSGIGV